MKYEIIIGAALLLLLAGCALRQTEQPSGALVANTNEASYDAADAQKDDCVMKKHPRVDVYDCFGCSNNNCRDVPADWRDVGENVPRIQCVASPRGCVVA